MIKRRKTSSGGGSYREDRRRRSPARETPVISAKVGGPDVEEAVSQKDLMPVFGMAHPCITEDYCVVIANAVGWMTDVG